jgi:hypothetical protein
VTEAELQSNVRQVARLGGFITYHTNDSRRSDKGFPDLVMVHPMTGRVVYAELKSEKGRIRPEQQQWIDALARGGHTVHVWRPEDWHDGTIREVLMAERRAA